MSTTTESSTSGQPSPSGPTNFFDRYFEITARKSTLSREIRGGFATFFTMAYIVVLNPLILGSAVDGDGKTLAMPAIAAATALIAGLMTILMGVVGRFPLALAAGLGVNAMVAYEIAPKMTWADAMGLVVIEGVIIAVLVLTGLRTAIFRSVPTPLKTATGVGIGLFLALIGFVDSGFVQGAAGSPPLTLAMVANSSAGQRRLRRRSTLDPRLGRQTGPRSHFARYLRLDHSGDHRRGGRQGGTIHGRRRHLQRPRGGASTFPRCRTPSLTSRTYRCWASSTCSARGKALVSWSRGCSSSHCC